MDDGDPVMEMYKAKAIVIEKEAEIEILRRRIAEMDRERQQRNQGEPSSHSREAAILKLEESNALLKQRVEQSERRLEESMRNIQDRLEETQTQKLEETEIIKIINDRLTALEETNKFDRIERRLEEITARLDRNEAENVQKGMEVKAANLRFPQRRTTLEDRIKGENETVRPLSVGVRENPIDCGPPLPRSRRPPLIREREQHILEWVITLGDRSKGGNETILIMGGERGNEMLDEMVILNRKTSTWRVLNLKLPCKNKDGGSALLNGEIYIFGGSELMKKSYKFDSQQIRWIQLAEMNEGRRCINNSSLVFQGCIWVFGGWNGKAGLLGEALDTVEKYCPERNEWIEMRGMTQKRYAAAAAVCSGKIFVSGGHDGFIFLKSVECFDPTSGVWTPVADMPGDRFTHSMISDGSSLFVMGGGDEIYNFNTVWRIRPSEESAIWEELQPINESRGTFTANSLCCFTNDYKMEIFAIGGWSGKQTLDSVEIFDGERWREGPKLPNGCNSMSSVVIPSSLAKRLFST